MATLTSLHPAPGRILLRSNREDDVSQLLAFLDHDGRIDVWRTPDEARRPPRRVASFPGPFGPRAVARLLASGEAGPAISEEEAEDALVEGIDGRWADLLRLAWIGLEDGPDPRVLAVLSLEDRVLDDLEERCVLDAGELLELGSFLVERSEDWLGEWSAEIEAEVERRCRAGGFDTDDESGVAIRSFVEECLLTLGRLPRRDEKEEAWDGLQLRDGPLDESRLKALGLVVEETVGRFEVAVRFYSAADTYGLSDSGSGPGWYFLVLNPDPSWRFNDPEGPYRTPGEALSDASRLADKE